MARPAVHFLLRQADLGKDAADVLGDEIIDRLRLMIKRRNGGHNDGTGLLNSQHVFQVDAAERRIAHAENESAIFFQHNVRGARDQIVTDAGGDRSQRAHRARNDQHGVDGATAGGDGGADVFVGKNFDLCNWTVEKAMRELFQVTRREAQLFGKEALACFGNDQMDVRDASVCFQKHQRFLREQSPAGAGHSHSYDLILRVGHDGGADETSLAAVSRQVKARRMPVR